MKLRDPWVDPRILQVTSADAQRYLLRRGWKSLGPAESNVEMLLFDGPSEEEGNPLIGIPVRTEQGPEVQRLIEAVTEIARFEDRYAGDVLSDILQPPPQSDLQATNGGSRAGDPAATGE
jgi:hypothetical protein